MRNFQWFKDVSFAHVDNYLKIRLKLQERTDARMKTKPSWKGCRVLDLALKAIVFIFGQCWNEFVQFKVGRRNLHAIAVKMKFKKCLHFLPLTIEIIFLLDNRQCVNCAILVNQQDWSPSLKTQNETWPCPSKNPFHLLACSLNSMSSTVAISTKANSSKPNKDLKLLVEETRITEGNRKKQHFIKMADVFCLHAYRNPGM